jgi:hypothetical protein
MPFRALSDLLGWRISQRTIDVCQLAAYLTLVLIVVAGFWRIQKVNDKLCDTTNANRIFIRKTLERSRKSLPTILYYRQNPGELRKALRDVNSELRGLPPDPCP